MFVITWINCSVQLVQVMFGIVIWKLWLDCVPDGFGMLFCRTY